MGKKKNSGIATAVLIGVLVVFFGTQITELTSFPKAIMATSGSTPDLCPARLDFSTGTSKFSISYSNHGDDDGAFESQIFSEEILSTYKDSAIPFSTSSSKEWFAEKDKIIPFSFLLKMADESKPPETITIDTNLKCSKFFYILNIPCGNIQHTCNYKTIDPGFDIYTIFLSDSNT